MMRRSFQLIAAAASLSGLVSIAVPAMSPVPVASMKVAPPSSDGCPPGSHRDQAAVDNAKKTYAADATGQAKAIAAVPCVQDAVPQGLTGGGETTGLQPPASKPLQIELKPLKPQ